MDPKLLTENNWKATVAKFKVKDNGLQKVLAVYEKLDESKFDDRLKAAASISQLAGTLKKDKAVAAMAPVVKYLTDVGSAADAEKSEITKAKAAAEKAAVAAKKAQDAAAKKDQEKEKEGDEEEDESGDAITKLTNALKMLRTAKQPYFFLVCDAKPYGLVVSKKEIKTNAQAKKELAQMAGGSTRPPKFGTCHFDSGKLAFDMEKPPSGLARILQKWIKDNTGLGLKVMVGTESAEDEEEGAKASAEADKGAEDKPGAGGIPKEKAAKFEKAAESWHGVREMVDGKVDELKKAILAHYHGRHPDLLKEIDKGLGKLDAVLDKLDHRLADSFTAAAGAANEAACEAELKKTKTILSEYIAYVKAEPLIAHVDSNPFGVKTNLKQTLIGAVTDAAKSIG